MRKIEEDADEPDAERRQSFEKKGVIQEGVDSARLKHHERPFGIFQENFSGANSGKETVDEGMKKAKQNGREPEKVNEGENSSETRPDDRELKRALKAARKQQKLESFNRKETLKEEGSKNSVDGIDDDEDALAFEEGTPITYSSNRTRWKGIHAQGELIYGTHSVLAALQAGKRQFYTLYHQETKDLGAADDTLVKVLRLAHKLKVPLLPCTKAVLQRVAGLAHNGLVLDCGALPMYVIKAPSETGEKQPVLDEGRYDYLDADLLRQLLYSQPLPFSPFVEKAPGKKSKASEAVAPPSPAPSSLDSQLLASLSSSTSPSSSTSNETDSLPPLEGTASLSAPASEEAAAPDSPSSSSPAVGSAVEGATGLAFSPVSPPALPPLWIAMDNVHDPMNIGGIMRTTQFFNCSGVLLGANCVGKLTPVISKASAGAMETVKVFKVADLARLLQSVTTQFPTADKWRVVALRIDAQAQDLRDFHRDVPTIVVVGNEGEGLRQPVAASCSHSITIKAGGVGELDSLNASTATAVAVYQLTKS